MQPEHHLLVVGSDSIVRDTLSRLKITYSLIINRQKSKLVGASRAKHIVLIDSESPEEWNSAAKLLNDLLPITGVGDFHETTQEIAAIIADNLEVSSAGKVAVCATRNKYLMRRALKSAGIDNIE